MTTGSALASGYRVVDRGELVRARVVAPAAALGWLPVTLGITGAAFGVPRSTAGTVVFALLALLAVALQVRLVVWVVQSWRPDPLLRVDPDGIEIRVERYGDDGRARRARLSWAEIGSVGVAPPPRRDDPGPVAAPAVEGYLAYEAGHGFGRRAAGRWHPGPGRTLVIVGLAPRSPAQAGELDRHLTVLRALDARSFDARAGGAGPLGSLAAQLVDWQRDWSAAAQPVGMHVAVRDLDLDPARLDAALRAHGRELQQREPPRGADLDTPHDIARLLAATARMVTTTS